MGYKMNGIPQLGGGEDAKKKLNTPYDSLKAGVGRKYFDADGEELFDRPMKLNEARSKIETGEYGNYAIAGGAPGLGKGISIGNNDKAYTNKLVDEEHWGEDFDISAARAPLRTKQESIAIITHDDKDGFYWYGKHHSIPKKRKPTPKMDKIPTKDIAKGKKVQAKVKNPPKPKVKRTLYTAASQLAKQGKPIGYTETKLPGASKVLRSNISAKEYKKK